MPSHLARPLRRLATLLALAGATSVLAQDLTHKAAPQSATIIIRGATIHPVAAPPIEDGTIVFTNGVITLFTDAAGADKAPADAEVIDATGLHIYPALISAETELGLVEFPPVRPTVDTTETGDVTPEVRPIVAVNPDSTLLPVTRSNGVLVVGVMPSGGSIPGQVSVMRLDGWTWEEMTVKASAGVLVNWPNVRPITAWWMDRSAEDQMRDIRQRLDTIDETFKTARAYADAKAADPAHPTDLRWEAMRAVFPATPPANITATSSTSKNAADDASRKPASAQLPVFITASERDQITSAVTWAIDLGLRPVIIGGRDAADCTDLLSRHDVPVIVQGTFAFPRRDDSHYDEAFTLPKRLRDAGVRFCIAGGDRTANERNLPYNAALAAAHGLSPDDALKSVTLWPAEILGVADSLGTLEPGKSATFIITDGNPLEITTNVRSAYIHGKKIDLRNKQSDLAEKYREKYRQLKAAPAKR